MDRIEEKELNQLMETYQMNVVNQHGIPTHKKGNVLDYVIATNNFNTTSDDYYVIDFGISDHNAILTLFQYQKLKPLVNTTKKENEKYKCPRVYYNFKRPINKAAYVSNMTYAIIEEANL